MAVKVGGRKMQHPWEKPGIALRLDKKRRQTDICKQKFQ